MLDVDVQKMVNWKEKFDRSGPVRSDRGGRCVVGSYYSGASEGVEIIE